MKIAIEIQADGEFCGACDKRSGVYSNFTEYGRRLRGWSAFSCGMYSKSLRSKNGKPKRCQQCIDAEIGDEK